MKRLTNRHYNVKWKCLLVIKHVAMKGSQNFRRDITREYLADIKVCLQFTGPPDPLRGDQIYQRVRDAARAAIDAVTSTTQIQNTFGNSSMAGMGSDSFGGDGNYGGAASNGGGGGGGGYNHGYEVNGPGRMTGIGSHPYDPNAKPPSKYSAIKSAGAYFYLHYFNLHGILSVTNFAIIYIHLFVRHFSTPLSSVELSFPHTTAIFWGNVYTSIRFCCNECCWAIRE